LEQTKQDVLQLQLNLHVEKSSISHYETINVIQRIFFRNTVILVNFNRCVHENTETQDSAAVFTSISNSVTIVSHYGLDGRVSIPDRERGFSSNLCVQTGSGVHPTSYTVGTGGSFPRDKARPGHDADHSPPSSAEVKKE
jgi:hypothetical protein